MSGSQGALRSPQKRISPREKRTRKEMMTTPPKSQTLLKKHRSTGNVEAERNKPRQMPAKKCNSSSQLLTSNTRTRKKWTGITKLRLNGISTE
eukprot:TRINITY_DN10521_c0_g1_i1.p1 TRINITY_DN10521_c0_g1~~TRINITY_DN10521_c0_g1_i1.p1  ORF type:complete len:93 (+),score=10.24 TRINITY_DN10521_c0_g1_i1:205-483(+)